MRKRKGKRLFSICFLYALLHLSAVAQHRLDVVVTDSSSHETLPGATGMVKGTTNAAAADINGHLVITGIQDGKSTIVLSLIGYSQKEIEVTFSPEDSSKSMNVMLSAQGIAIDEVTVSTTRTRSRIEDLPVKLEVIGIEDLDEESSVEPETIGSILGDVAGIQWQQTSAVSGNSSIRIQGLSGKYTQILRDGLPYFEGFSGGFGVLDIPPLDLKQVEIVKGSASTLYGGGAIGGLINLISKEPADSLQLVLSLNQTTLKESNLNIFSSGKNEKIGYTVLAGGTYQKAVDVDGDGFSDQTEVNSLMLHPRVFLYLNKKTQLNIGVYGSAAGQNGGDMQVIQEKADSVHTFFEKNTTSRGSLDLDLSVRSGKQNLFSVRGVASLFTRKLEESDFKLNAHQLSTYLETSYLIHHLKNDLITGINFTSSMLTIDNAPDLDMEQQGVFNDSYKNTVGLFALDDWKLTDKFSIETGFRADFVSTGETFLLPHASFLYKPGKEFTCRLSGGLGYKLHDIYAGDDQETDLKNVVSSASRVKPEHSAGANFDVNYHHLFGNTSFVVNESVFYTRIDQPISTRTAADGSIAFGNYDKYIDSKGSETYVRVGLEHVDFYLGYVYTQPERYTGTGVYDVALNARHKFAVDGLYEIENAWKFGVEAAYTGMQHINEYETRPGYTFVAAMVQKTIKNFLITVNCENLLDYRQSRKENVVIPPYNDPAFRPVWAPLEGRIINLAIRVNL